MAFDKRKIIDLTRILMFVIVAFPWTASANIDCGGKAFHCINSTHFMICVDLGGGVSSTIGGFVIPCPPSTVCRETNRFECELLIPVIHEQVANIVPDVTELPLTTAAMSTTSATTIPQAQNVISTLSITEFSQYTTDLSAINTTEQPHAQTDIGATNTTEFLQATTNTTAYNTTESIRTSTDMSATELPLAQTDTSAFNIFQTQTEFPQASTDISAPNRTEVLEAQTTNSVFVAADSFQASTSIIGPNLTELPPISINTSAPNISQAPSEFLQAPIDRSAPNRTDVFEAQITNSVFVTTESFQASTSIIRSNSTELPTIPIDTSAPNISQSPSEFPQAPSSGISAPNIIELLQAQTAMIASVTTERFQTSPGISEVNTTELPPATIDISAPNISQASSEFPQAPIDRSAPNKTEVFEAQITNGVFDTTESFQASTSIIRPNSTELPTILIDTSAPNIFQSPSEFPQASSGISAPNIIELLQAQTAMIASVTTERFQTSPGISEVNTTELPPATIDISALNISQAPTEFPQATTDISAFNRIDLPEAQTAKSASVTTERLKSPTDISATEFPSAPTDISAHNMSQASTEFPQAPTTKSASVSTELFQASTNVSKANVTELPPAQISTSAPYISQASTEFPQVTTDISAPNITDFFQEQTENSVFITSESLQVSTDVTKANTTDLPPAPKDLSATNNITEINNISVDINAITTTMLPQTQTSISVPNTFGITQAPPDTIAPNTSITKIESATDNGVHSTITESSQILTDIIATSTLTDMSTPIIIENFETSTDHTSASMINKISQTPTDISATNQTDAFQALINTNNNIELSQITEVSKVNTTRLSQTFNNYSAPIVTEIYPSPVGLSATNTIMLHQAPTDTSANNKSEPLQIPTEVSTGKLTDIFQALTDVSATNTTEPPHVPADIDATNIIKFLLATASITAYNTTESLQTTTDISATEFPPALADISVPTISGIITEFQQPLTEDNVTKLPPAPIDINLPKTIKFTQSPTDIGVPNTTDFPQATKIWDPNNTIATTYRTRTTLEVQGITTTNSNFSEIYKTNMPITNVLSPSNKETEINVSKQEIPTIKTIAIANGTADVQSLVIKVLTDSTTFDTTQTHAGTLSYEITTESESSINKNLSALNSVDSIATRLPPEDTFTSEISPTDTALNIITNSGLSTTPSIVQNKVPLYLYTREVIPNETTYKDVTIVDTIEAYKNLTQYVPTTLVGDSIIKQNISITTLEPILTGFEETSTNSFIEPTTSNVNTYTELELNKQVLNKTIEPEEKSKVQRETNVNIFETLISSTRNQTWAIGLGVTQASFETQKQFTTSLFSDNSEIITEPTITNNTEDKIPSVAVKNTETTNGIDSYTPIQQITDSNQYSLDITAKVLTNVLPTKTSQINNIVQQSLYINQNALINDNIVQVTNSPVESTTTSPHNTLVVTNQLSNIPQAGYNDSQGSKNQDVVTEQYLDLSITNVNYFDNGVSTSDMNKRVLQTNTGIVKGIVTEQYTTEDLNDIIDVPVSTTEMSPLTSIIEAVSHQGISKNKVFSTIDLHATLSPWAINTQSTTNIEQGVNIAYKVEDKGLHDFSKAPNGPAADVQTATQRTMIKQGSDLRTINASFSVDDNVRTISQYTTETRQGVGAESITSTSSSNLIGVNELTLPVIHFRIPSQIPVEQNVNTINTVFTNKTDLNDVIVSKSPADKILAAPLNNKDFEHGAHYVENTFNDTVRSYSPADNVPFTLKNKTDIGIPRNYSEFRTTSLPPANTQNSQQNYVNSSNAVYSMPINTQIILPNSTHIVDVEQDSKLINNTDLNVSNFEITETVSRNSTEGISVLELPVSSFNFTFDVRGRNDMNVNRVHRNLSYSSVTTVMDNLSQASLSKFINVKQEIPTTVTNFKNENFKLILDSQQMSPIKDIQKSDISASTPYSHVVSIISDKTSSASDNAAVIVNSQVALDANDNVRHLLIGRDFLIKTENIDDEKLNFNQEKSIGNIEDVVVQSPLLPHTNVTKFSKLPTISSIKFGNPSIESITSTQSSLEKIESKQSNKESSKDNSQPIKQETQSTRNQTLISKETTGYTKSPSGVSLNDSVIFLDGISPQNITDTKETLVSELIKVQPNEQLVNSNTATMNKEISTVTEPKNEFTHQPPNEVIQFFESHNDDINLFVSSNIANSNKEVDNHTVILATKHIETSTSPQITGNNETPNVLKSKEINGSNTTNIDRSIQSNTAINIENNSKLKPSLAHANISLKITSKTTAIIHHHIPKTSEKHYCRNRNRGRYSDREDCSKFYICIGRLEPIIGKCPTNTVFSDINKQCTKNISHCIRESEFKCTSPGRYSDILQQNIYYICVPSGDVFIRFKFQCQNGYHLNKTSVKCYKQSEIELQQQTSISVDSKSEKSTNDDRNAEKDARHDNSKSEKSTNDDRNAEKDARHDKESKKSVEEFKCEEEGRFGDANNCRKYYVCTKRNKKSEFRRRKKKCDSDEVFHKDKKKCVDAESYEC